MTLDERALLDAIIAAPDDDLPRLVYADWLDEHGDPERAEYIRLDCERHRLRLGVPADRKRYDAMDPRLVALNVAHLKRWAREALAEFPANKQTFLLFSRGLPGTVGCTEKYFRENGADLVRRLPIRTVLLRKPTAAGAAQLARSPAVGELRGWRFDYTGPASDEAVRTALASWPRPPLLNLNLSTAMINSASTDWHDRWADMAGWLATHPAMSQVKTLKLQGLGVGDAGGRALAASPRFERLEAIELSHNPMSPATVARPRKRFGDRLVLSLEDAWRFPCGYFTEV